MDEQLPCIHIYFLFPFKLRHYHSVSPYSGWKIFIYHNLSARHWSYLIPPSQTYKIKLFHVQFNILSVCSFCTANYLVKKIMCKSTWTVNPAGISHPNSLDQQVHWKWGLNHTLASTDFLETALEVKRTGRVPFLLQVLLMTSVNYCIQHQIHELKL